MTLGGRVSAQTMIVRSSGLSVPSAIGFGRSPIKSGPTIQYGHVAVPMASGSASRSVSRVMPPSVVSVGGADVQGPRQMGGSGVVAVPASPGVVGVVDRRPVVGRPVLVPSRTGGPVSLAQLESDMYQHEVGVVSSGGGIQPPVSVLSSGSGSGVTSGSVCAGGLNTVLSSLCMSHMSQVPPGLADQIQGIPLPEVTPGVSDGSVAGNSFPGSPAVVADRSDIPVGLRTGGLSGSGGVGCSVTLSDGHLRSFRVASSKSCISAALGMIPDVGWVSVIVMGKGGHVVNVRCGIVVPGGTPVCHVL